MRPRGPFPHTSGWATVDDGIAEGLSCGNGHFSQGEVVNRFVQRGAGGSAQIHYDAHFVLLFDGHHGVES